MKTVRSYVVGEWYEASDGFVPLVNPSTGETIARVSSRGVDFAAVLRHAREVGGPALRAMTFGARAELLGAMSKALRAGRDELLELSCRNNGTTEGDGSFDIDGASGTLYYYAKLGQGLGDGRFLPDGEGTQLAKTEGFWAQHALTPRLGAAVHINAFNFPVWGFAEKAACALLAGMPVVTKPATATALVAERAVEMIVEADVLPEGALQLVCGSTGDLLDRLGPQDVLAFTGSAATAARLRDRDNFRSTNVHVNVEADSLNAAVLGPDVEADGVTLDLFVRDVVREMTQKAGQKCTAVRRILVPREAVDRVAARLSDRLAKVTVGDPSRDGVHLGPLATAQQLEDARRGLEALGGERLFPDGEPDLPQEGYFLAPTLLLDERGDRPGPVHEIEVFAPVASIIPYDGSPAEAGRIVALGGGTLVTSLYSDDAEWLEESVERLAPTTGRIYIGSEGSAEVAPGSGAALPQTLHGGPGRAGGGEELGGLVGLELYMQRVAVTGERALVERLTGG
ncbi:MAG: 3,4-dehydroadipyl-CoA semialdehyde dehydrogenase [Thermoanaerobaculia bacterium]|nr:3,4-dehydroadipyl-CoA semialdehyde dehydrogenase [Thermoanaerobaculia bacterium]